MDGGILEKIQNLNDLELAILVSLISEEHCSVSTDLSSTLELERELHLVCTEAFGLRPAVVRCRSNTTVDELNDAILITVGEDEKDTSHEYEEERRPAAEVDFSRPRPSRLKSDDTTIDKRRIANVVIATDLDLAGQNVQVQLIELLRTKRMFTRTEMHVAPKAFLLVAILSKPRVRVSYHLNDMISTSHFHPADDGLSHLEGDGPYPVLSSNEIDLLRTRARETRLTAEIDAYLHDIVMFMRMSRYVQGGVSPTATRHLRAVSKALAPLHGVDYVTPSLVMLAARKIYPHRLVLATPETEKSLQWGSDPVAVRRVLEGVVAEDVIEDVIASVETPL